MTDVPLIKVTHPHRHVGDTPHYHEWIYVGPIAAYAEDALRDPDTAAHVRLVLRYRRENGVGRPVTKLRSVTR